jgi:acyl-CoA reductase-like NAD-dependent aldehyde dehydrogenase
MQAQLARLPEWFRYFGAVARTQEGAVPPFGGAYLNYTRRVPLGVVGLITPWNHPLLILTKKVAPAMAAGNTMVVKPSELAPVTPLLLGEVFKEAGIPDGVYNVVPGYGATAGAALTEHRGIRKIDITGGTETGKVIASLAGRNLTRVAAELGGKAAVVVFPDTDIDRSVAAALFASFIASGQTCVQGARLLVHRSIHDRVVQEIVRRTAAIRLGDPVDPQTQMGPMVSAKQRDLVERYVAIGVEEGATLAAGGRRPSGAEFEAGFYYLPTVFTGVSSAMRIAQEEIFGPVMCVIPFDTEDEAVGIVNDTEFGLAASVWTQDVGRAHRVAHRLESGIVWINDHHRIDPSSPWGGFKMSGIGRENGLVAYHEYTQSQSVIVNLSDEPFDWYADDGQAKRYS